MATTNSSIWFLFLTKSVRNISYGNIYSKFISSFSLCSVLPSKKSRSSKLEDS